MISSMSENLIAQNFCTMENPTVLNMENRFKHQTHTHRVDDFVVNEDWSHIDRLGGNQGGADRPCTLEGICTGTLDRESTRVVNLPDSQQGTWSALEQNTEVCMASEDLNHNVDKIEGELPSSLYDAELPVPVFEWSEQDENVALWVKWRGKWQAGIRCARVDCPLTTLKAKPTHDRKKYFVVFFPHTRNHSWVDLLLVRPIHEFPEPIAHKTHDKGLEKVKDLSLPRRFIMQRIAVGMLSICDQLHNEAVIESARKVTAWKEFALMASRCNDYSDLGGMLLKLQSMILKQYIDSDWLNNSFESWAQRCRNAQSAESVEMLKEELEDSILWNEIEALWDAPVQPELDPEWKTWKQEAMKWFSTSHPLASGRDAEERYSDDSMSVGLQLSNKRAKLEVRRAEMHASQVETSVSHEVQSHANTTDIASGFLNSSGLGTENRPVFESYKDITLMEGAATSECPGTVVDRWEEIVVESGNNGIMETTEGQKTPAVGDSVGKSLESGNRYQQCLAFIEAKGRQCVRWANDGDVYCCVHLAVRSPGTIAKAELTSPVNAPMCEGTTVLGTKCKHRAQYGSTFCKKHRPQNGQYLTNVEMTSSLPGNTLKRSHSEISPVVPSGSSNEAVSVREVQNPVQTNSGFATKGETLDGKGTTSLVQKSEHFVKSYNNTEFLRCIGSYPQNNNDPCSEHPKLHTLYCEKHLPNFLKRARNGKPRIISKEIFIEFLRNCSSIEQKLHLHRACVLLHGYIKSVVSNKNPVAKGDQLQWILSEATRDLCVGEFLMKLISREKEKLKTLWGFDVDNDKQISSGALVLQQAADEGSHDTQKNCKCKICSKEFPDDEMLGVHWMDVHKNEAESLFRGYACAICLNSFTDKKVLETHVGERHEVPFVEQCVLFHCIPCGSQFMNPEQLWIHVLSVHSKDFRLTVVQPHNHSAKQVSQRLEPATKDASQNSRTNGGSQGLVCKFCGLKFDLLPDLGRHHQAAHMGSDSASHKSKSSRLNRPSFTKGLQKSAYRIRNRGNIRMKKRFQASSSANAGGVKMQCDVSEADGLGRLEESQCSAVANILFAEIQKAKPRPSNRDILSVARVTCCKINLQAALEERFEVLPERLYLKAAKLCSELNIPVEWHREGFVCPKGCKPATDPLNISSLSPLPSCFLELAPSKPADTVNTIQEWEMDECHYIVDSQQIKSIPMEKSIVLCEDLSFGRESAPVNCVVDEDLVHTLRTSLDGGSNGGRTVSMPWEEFTYVTKRLLGLSLGRNTESSQLGCACPPSSCSPEGCDHVYLFDNDYENAKDIHGELMHGKFPYDSQGRIILEEGYVVYECNSSCTCGRTCPNRVLQNGVQVKIEVFKTENKGWAVRAGEAIARGTFVCEYIGEVLNDWEANNRDDSYLYKIEADTNDMSGLTEGGVVPHVVIDATRYGNVSRFINHSCSPNLVTYQVLIDSMDCHLAHIGLYASRDIAVGEELAYDYNRKLLLSGALPCHCGSPNCRGQIC